MLLATSKDKGDPHTTPDQRPERPGDYSFDDRAAIPPKVATLLLQASSGDARGVYRTAAMDDLQQRASRS
jgi:hypothetical protein